LPTLRDDIDTIGPTLSGSPVDHATVIGPHPVYVEESATIEPLVVFDVSAGPVMVRAGSTVRAFTRVVGPCAIGADTQILGDRVSGCSIGDQCVVRGEISESIVTGQANKGHEGFVGHSVLGRWVNLGAGTITSNLKNSYGTVSLWTPQGVRDTGTVKLGTLFGDHVKTGIGARLTTGSVIGAGSNVYGSVMPPRYVAPFSWGDGEAMTEYRLDEFLRTTERAMSRRSVALNDAMRRQLSASHALARRGR
jgi:UDP-N-acetylglucosamine diphosphorylase/glucosamine-1-phosphate N-acetyltransferase